MAQIIDTASMEPKTGTGYPDPYAAQMTGRFYRRIAEAGGLSQFGVNLVTLKPGAWSSQRHWHAREDELVLMLEGEATLVTDAGEQTMRPGQAVCFKAGAADGHHLINRSGEDLVFLVVGSKFEDERAVYPDIDLLWSKETGFTRRDGVPYPPRE